jgi:LAO/AO transport system kinase
LSPRKSESVSEQDTAVLADGVLEGNRRALAQAITLTESTRRDHRASASALLERLIPYAGNSIRLGISGVPGVGKSTFIEALGNHVIDAGHRVAALTVDPSSAISGGSILGDKTRMEQLSRRSDAFIRPSPTGNTLGGVTGVGQSETKVADMTDMFVLLLLPGAGDELQGIKRGIVELADLILINKADDNLVGQAAAEYRNALRLLHPRSANWKVEVECCSARDGVGIAEAWEIVLRHHEMLDATGQFTVRRAAQARDWLWSDVNDNLVAALQSDPEVRKQIPALEAAASEGRISPTIAARQLLEIFLKRHKKWDE